MPSQPDKNSKKLTVLFADIVGSTGLFELYGDSQARKVEKECIDTLMDITKKRNGWVIKQVGDGVMCAFEKTMDSIAAAREMHLAVTQDSRPTECGLSIKVGLHFGDVIVENKDVFGDNVNIAARVVEKAKSGQILTTSQTLRILPMYFAAQARILGKIKVKGKKSPIEIVDIVWNDSDDLTLLHISKHELPRSYLILRFDNRELLIDSNITSIALGRHSKNDLILNGKSVSKNHAKIEFRSGKFVLIDHSSNGTYIRSGNGELLRAHYEEVSLQGDGQISLGEHIFLNEETVIDYKVCVET